MKCEHCGAPATEVAFQAHLCHDCMSQVAGWFLDGGQAEITTPAEEQSEKDGEDRWTEPGRYVSESGMIVYEWPPQGRFAELWRRFVEAFPDRRERTEVASLQSRAWFENATLVAYEDDDTGEMVDVEWDWSQAPQADEEGKKRDE